MLIKEAIVTKGLRELQVGKRREITKEKQVNTGHELQVADSNILEKDQMPKKTADGQSKARANLPLARKKIECGWLNS